MFQYARALPFVVLVLLMTGCSSDSPTAVTDDPPLPTNLPPVPVPTSTNDLLPVESARKVIGLSDPVREFDPHVVDITLRYEDDVERTTTVGRRLSLVCHGKLTRNTSTRVAPGEFLSAAPRVVHRRYWRKLNQQTLNPNTSFEKKESVTSGTSTEYSTSRAFSRTLGAEVSVGVGWGPLETELTASFEQTATTTEIQTVTFSQETTVEQTYSVQSDPEKTIVWVLWQLVDEFSIVDADTVAIDQSSTLLKATIAPVAYIAFPNENVLFQSVTKF